MDGARRQRRRSGSRVRSVSPAQQASPSEANRIKGKGHHENTKSANTHKKEMPQRHKDTERFNKEAPKFGERGLRLQRVASAGEPADLPRIEASRPRKAKTICRLRVRDASTRGRREAAGDALRLRVSVSLCLCGYSFRLMMPARSISRCSPVLSDAKSFASSDSTGNDLPYITSAT